MKILLINASVSRGLAYGLDDGMPEGLMAYLGGYQPLGICYLAAVLRQHGFSEIELIDAEAEDLSFVEVARRAIDAAPDLIGISCVTFSFLYALDLARAIKAQRPCPVILGGANADIYPAEVLTHSCFDAVVSGEGEYSFLEVVRLFAATMSGDARATGLPRIPGVGCRVGDEVRLNPERPVVANLDDLPFAARDLLQIQHYRQNYLPNPFVSLLTARGCPFRCSYCSRPEWTRRIRYHSPRYVVDEIEHCMKEFAASSFQFFDDTFTVNRERVLEICRQIRARRLAIQFLALSRVDGIDRELLDALKQAGCSCISFGVESGDEGILKAMNKRYRPAQIGPAFELCREYGIDVVAYYLLGHPAETRASVSRTLQSIRRTRPSWFKANVLIPYPASALLEELVADGVMEDVWRRMTIEGRTIAVPHICRALTRKQLERYRIRINLMPYFRTGSNLLNFKRLSNPANVLWSIRWLLHCVRRYVWA